MSILNRPGWANRPLINEGRLHSDELKHRITNLFKRTSLGNSPTYVVGKIAEILRREKGDDVDINDVTDEDIIVIANCEEVTNGKFSPELKDAIEDSRQESGESLPDVAEGLPSEKEESDDSLESPESERESEPESIESSDIESSSEDEEEDAEAVKKTADCECYKHDSVGSVGSKGESITKESTRPSNQKINQLLKESYIKSRQHKFKMEEKYRIF